MKSPSILHVRQEATSNMRSLEMTCGGCHGVERALFGFAAGSAAVFLVRVGMGTASRVLERLGVLIWVSSRAALRNKQCFILCRIGAAQYFNIFVYSNRPRPSRSRISLLPVVAPLSSPWEEVRGTVVRLIFVVVLLLEQPRTQL